MFDDFEQKSRSGAAPPEGSTFAGPSSTDKHRTLVKDTFGGERRQHFSSAVSTVKDSATVIVNSSDSEAQQHESCRRDVNPIGLQRERSAA